MTDRTADAEIEAALASGLALHRGGRPGEAESHYRRALERSPGHGRARAYLGAALRAQGRLDEALAVLRQAVDGDPENTEAHVNLGNVLAQMGDTAAAESHYLQALQLQPTHAEAHANLAALRLAGGDREDAVAGFRQAAMLAPENGALQFQAGRMLMEDGDPESAVHSLARAVALLPEDAAAHNDFGNALFATGSLEKAAEHYRKAIALMPGLVAAHNNLGSTERARGRLKVALDCYDRALALDEYHGEVRFNRAQTLLLAGRWAEGWAAYEDRFRKPGAPPRPVYRHPEWDGGEVKGRTVLVHAEQGLGDTLQFVRYARLLADRGARVMVLAPEAICPLLETVEGVSAAYSQEKDLPPFHCHVPLLSLPRLFGTTGDNIPGATPYLSLPDKSSAFDQEATPGGEPVVGLVWAGNPDHADDRNRSIDLSVLLPLLDGPRLRFVSLQVGAARKDIARLGLEARLPDLGRDFRDFTETARAISALDLVISVDTAVAHLAGALDRPVWTLLPMVPDWRWGMKGDRTPWYPSMRMFRQHARGDWVGVVDAVAEALVARFT